MPISDIQFLDHVIWATGTSEHVPQCAKVRRLLAEQVEQVVPGVILWIRYAVAPAGIAAGNWTECGLCGEQLVSNCSARNLDGRRHFRVALGACARCRMIRWDICELRPGRVSSVRTVPAGVAKTFALRLADERRAATQRGCRQLSADYAAAREAARASAWLGYPWRSWEPAPREIPNDLVSAMRRRALAASYQRWQAAVRDFGPQWNTYIDLSLARRPEPGPSPAEPAEPGPAEPGPAA